MTVSILSDLFCESCMLQGFTGICWVNRKALSHKWCNLPGPPYYSRSATWQWPIQSVGHLIPFRIDLLSRLNDCECHTCGANSSSCRPFAIALQSCSPYPTVWNPTASSPWPPLHWSTNSLYHLYWWNIATLTFFFKCVISCFFILTQRNV